MAKVSFFGNCQLENIGNLVHNVAQQHQLGIEVLWTKAAYQTKPEEYISLIYALENSDIIYTQYHDQRWGLFATQNLQKSFPMKIVPTLESFASVVQTGEWNIEPSLASLNIHFMDFRMLDLYLQHVPAESVEEQYFQVTARPGAIEKEIQRMAEKYHDYFTTGKVIFDYSEPYKNAMQRNPQSYHTFNHPDNTQMEWLLNSITADIGIPLKINFDGPELLDQFQMPSLIGEPRVDYKIFQTKLPLKVVAKVFYTYFNAIDQETLHNEFRKSSYAALMNVNA